MKIGFDGEFSEAEIKTALNSALPPGFEITAAKMVEAKSLIFQSLIVRNIQLMPNFRVSVHLTLMLFSQMKKFLL